MARGCYQGKGGPYRTSHCVARWNSFAPQNRLANDGSESAIGSAHDGNAYSDYYYGISSWDGGSGGTTATGYYYLQALVPRCTCRGRVVHATRIHACRPP